ncbi:MAG: 3-isopropylmalate dehydrogenase [Anaerolineales bacterium]|nr:3-isopropylmalate dehydrogenase [Anaerolineales bacterium]
MQAKIIVLPGDGIGPEVTAAAMEVLQTAAEKFNHKLTFEEHLFGGCAIDSQGVPLSENTLAACKAADAILLGAVGGPKWDSPSASVRPEQGLLRLRKELDLFANLRPVKVFPALIDSSPLRRERVENVDILFLRELTSGIYFGQPRERKNIGSQETALDTMFYSEDEVRRIAHLAFETSQKRRKSVTSVDKANVLESSRLWRKVVIEVSGSYPDVTLHHQLVDSMAMRIIQGAGDFDVVVTSNMFGDILTDEASVLSGSLGLLPSASLRSGSLGLYEPIHGSAPDIAGKGLANPIGSVLSAAMLFRYSLNLDEEARCIETAVQNALDQGARTADLADSNTLTTTEMTGILCKLVLDA